ncbi:hypothetical protein [Neptuniibacter marinus]|uniref:hypothetical protein n=1 Tax=Neptuniibacter marinus TaxID=1806670 RepID=UPI003B59B2AC
MKLRDLIKINDATIKHGVAINDILFDALDGNLTLLTVSKKEYRECLIPCIDKGTHEANGSYIHQFEPLFDHKELIDIQIGQILAIPEKQIKELTVNQQFSEVELYKPLATAREDLVMDFWKSEREVFDFQKGFPRYPEITLDDVYVLDRELLLQVEKTEVTDVTPSNTETASRTSLKVIGLLMHHLAKSPRYASGTSPNKSQIKELLIDLAEELDVNNYGLSKVDERLLADAMNYLEDQKN